MKHGTTNGLARMVIRHARRVFESSKTPELNVRWDGRGERWTAEVSNDGRARQSEAKSFGKALLKLLTALKKEKT